MMNDAKKKKILENISVQVSEKKKKITNKVTKKKKKTKKIFWNKEAMNSRHIVEAMNQAFKFRFIT